MRKLSVSQHGQIPLRDKPDFSSLNSAAPMEIIQIPVLTDNYIYLLHDDASGMTAAVDPAEAMPVMEILDSRSWTLTHILNTHHHGDHVGGNRALKQATGCHILGWSEAPELIPEIDEQVGEGDRIQLGHLLCEVFAVPGHTRHHIAFWFAEERALFCGDTLFAMGCGRLLGGSAGQLWASLVRLRQLPSDTRVFCTHEYTQNNGRFALTVDPDNNDLKARMREVDAARAAGKATVPFLLSEEWVTNPFLRPESRQIRTQLEMVEESDLAVFSELRKRKDNF